MEESHLASLKDILFAFKDSKASQVASEYSLDEFDCSLDGLVAPLDLEHAPVALNRNSCLQLFVSLLFSFTADMLNVTKLSLLLTSKVDSMIR